MSSCAPLSEVVGDIACLCFFVSCFTIDSLVGTEYCCEYNNPDDGSEDVRNALGGFFTAYLIYFVIALGCGLFWTCGPCIFGLCIWCCHMKEQKRRNEEARSQAVAAAKIQPSNQHAGLPIVVYDQL